MYFSLSLLPLFLPSHFPLFVLQLRFLVGSQVVEIATGRFVLPKCVSVCGGGLSFPPDLAFLLPVSFLFALHSAIRLVFVFAAHIPLSFALWNPPVQVLLSSPRFWGFPRTYFSFRYLLLLPFPFLHDEFLLIVCRYVSCRRESRALCYLRSFLG